MQISPRQTYGIGALLAVLLGLAGWTWVVRVRAAPADLVITGRTPPVSSLNPALSSASATLLKPQLPANGSATEPNPPVDSPAPKEVVIHVAGSVKKPGVYHLRLDSRGEDAVKAAGGAKPDANLDAINLAAKIEDGQQLYIPTKQEQPTGGAPEQPSKSQAQRQKSSPGPTGSVRGHASPHGTKLTAPGQGTININRASAEDLQRLPGVGPAMAARIIDFRKENRSFSAIDQLMDVSGIGAKKYAKMQPFVRVK